MCMSICFIEKNHYLGKIFYTMFIATLSMIANTWKQPKSSMMDKEVVIYTDIFDVALFSNIN